MPANRFYNPPDEVRAVGRRLRLAATYDDLASQLAPGEVLIALFTNQAPALVAAEVPSQQRLAELDRVWGPTQFYAVAGPVAEVGFARGLGTSSD